MLREVEQVLVRLFDNLLVFFSELLHFLDLGERYPHVLHGERVVVKQLRDHVVVVQLKNYLVRFHLYAIELLFYAAVDSHRLLYLRSDHPLFLH